MMLISLFYIMKNNNLFILLASYYGLYVKTHSYHWNVLGQNFEPLHKMFNEQYDRLAEEIDEIAERIRMLGEKIPASLSKFASLSVVSEPNENLNDKEMVQDLYESNQKLITFMNKLLEEYEAKNDAVTIDFITQKLAVREKDSWFLLATVS